MLPYVDHLPHTLDLSRNAFTLWSAGAWGGQGGRAGGAGGAARGGHDRGRDGGAAGGLDGGAAAARRATCSGCGRHLHEIRHPADLRRGDHRVRPHGHEFRRGAAGRGAGHHDDGEGPDQRRGADGGGGGERTAMYDAIVHGAPEGIELFHGYTYSGHPLACAAAIATMDLQRAEDLPGRAAALEPYLPEGGALPARAAERDRHPRHRGWWRGSSWRRGPGKPTDRAVRVFGRCFDDGLLVRTTGDIVALIPAAGDRGRRMWTGSSRRCPTRSGPRRLDVGYR